MYALLKAELNQSEIATLVGVHQSTIRRERRRHRRLRGYRPKQAHQLARHRRQTKIKPRICDKDWRLVERLLRED
ncbi:MAG TPA: hypothetical protein ENN02_02630 [Halothiobacillus sp.]|nr:hypothetical protein [Halothiobacillus sp.]